MKRRIAFAVGLLTFTVASSAYLSISAHFARQRTEGHLEELQRWRTDLETTRDAAWGDAVDGAASPHYEAAWNAVESPQSEWRAAIAELSTALGTDDGADVETLARVTREHAEALRHLRLGAHAKDGRIDLDFSAGAAIELPYLRDTRYLSDLTVAKLLVANTPAQQVDAVRSILDAQQLGRDLASSPLLITEMIGLAVVVPSSIEEHLAEGLLTRLDDRAVREWLRGVERIEASLATKSLAFRGELELCATACLYGPAPVWSTGGAWFENLIERGVNGLQFDQHVARHCESTLALMPELEAAYELPFQEGYDRLMEISRAGDRSGNPVTRLHTGFYPTCLNSRAWNRARLSFLRHGLALHLGEAAPAPLDAFGLGVTVERDGDRVTISTPTPDDRVLSLTL